jgi:serine/threonine protein kinase
MNDIVSTQEIERFLGGIKILKDIESEAIQDIAASVRSRYFEAGQTIISRGQTSERLYIIFGGEVQVLIPDILRGGERKVILTRGAMLGEVSLLTKRPYSADVTALKDTSLLFLDLANFDRLIETHKSFAKMMSHMVGGRMSLNGGINQVGKYKLLDKLGESNMSIVFNAFDPDLEREVAIKMLKYELSHDPEFLTRFKYEARTIAGLNHPNIVDVYEILEELSTGFMVMEKLSGLTLAEVLKQKVSLSVMQTRRILFQVANALHYAHTNKGHGIVHRDIKPSNIIINVYNHVTITDFGIAQPPASKADNIEGSPHYLAPEVIQSKPVDGRADIYAMGILGFHLLTGSPAFPAKSVDKILDMHVNQKPPDIRKLVPDIDDNLASFIEQALEKDVSHRISDWNEIKRLLSPTAGKQQVKVNHDEIVFLTRLQDASYQDVARVINKLKSVLEEIGLQYKINMEREDKSEETMSIIAINPNDLK